MNVLDLLDRMLQRRHERIISRPVRPPMDIKVFVGLLFLTGYYVMVWRFSGDKLPTENLDLIRDAMLTLGPPVGAIVSALFRSDARDAQATANTAEAFRAMRHVADSTSGPSGTPGDPIAVEGATRPGKPVSVQEKGKKP